MRKTLLATAAVLIAAGAHADSMSGGVSVSGSANFGVKLDGSKSGSDGFSFHHEFDITFAASGTTDAGMTFGASTKIDNNEGISAEFTGDPQGFTDGTSAGSGTPTLAGDADGTIPALLVRETLAFAEDGNDSDDDNVACILGQDGRIFIVPETGDIDASTGFDTPDNTNGGVMRTHLNGRYMTAEEVMEALGDAAANIFGEREEVDPDFDTDTATAGTQGYHGYRFKAPSLDADGTDNTCIATNTVFAPGVLTTDSDALEGGSSTGVTGLVEVTGNSTGISQGSVSGSVNNDATVYIEMSGHKLTIGDVSAADGLAGGIDGVGFDGIGAKDAAGSLQGETSADVRYDGSFGVASVAASMGGDNDWAAGFSFSVAPVSVGIGFASDSAATVGLGLSQGQVSGKVVYSSKGGDKAMGVSAAYSMTDATSVTLVYSRAGDEDGVGVGFSHDLGGGATLKAGAGQVNGDTKADLGITMSF